MSPLRFVCGLLLAAACAAPWVAVTRALHRRLLTVVGPATAAVTLAIGTLSTVLMALHVLGTVGAYRPVVLPMAIGGIGAVAWWAERRSHVDPASADMGRDVVAAGIGSPRLRAWVLVGIGLVVTAWVGWTAAQLVRSMTDFDTLRYHGPVVGRWLQSGFITRLHHTSYELQETFFPTDVELLDGLGVSTIGSDLLTVLRNLGWLALLLTASASIGESIGRRWSALGVGAVLAAVPLLIIIDAGTAKTDLAALAVVVCVAALILVARRLGGSWWWLVGAAAGMAAGIKLTTLAVVVVVVGTALVAERRWAAAVRVGIAALLTGSFWYVRNWVRTGSPLPWISGAGSHLRFETVEREGFTVAHFLGSGRFWSHVVPPELTRSLSPLWPVLFVVAGVGVVAGLRHASSRPLALGAIGGVAIYVVTPYSAGGAGATASMFGFGLRFALPAVALALFAALVALAPPGARATAPESAVTTPAGASRVGTRAALTGLVAVLVFAGAFVVYRAHRYASDEPGRRAAGAWFRDVRDARVAMGGLDADYPFYGLDLSNHVQVVGDELHSGGFERAATCRRWRELLADGNYDWIVTGQPREDSGPPVEATWTDDDPALTVELRSGSTTVWRVIGTPDPDGCP